MSLKEIFVSKKKELEKLEADIQKQKEKQQKKVESVQTEYDALVQKSEAWKKEVQNYKLDKPSFIRLAYCLKASITKRVVSEMLVDGWTNKEVEPEPIETLIPKYRVELLVQYLNNIDMTEIKAPVTETEIKEASKQLEKEKKKLSKL